MASSRQEETAPGTEQATGSAADAAEDPGSEETGAGLVDDPVSELEARIAELEARLRAVSSAYKDKQEEIHGIKARLERQAAVQEEIRRGEVVTTLFEPVENLHRSLDAVKGHAAEGGLRMVYQQFMDALQRLGLEEVPGVGSVFDPTVHEAIATAPVADNAHDGRVVSVFSAGYRIGGRLVKPARVVIGSYSPAGEA